MNWLIFWGILLLIVAGNTIFVRTMYKARVFDCYDNWRVGRWLSNFCAIVYTITGWNKGCYQKETVKSFKKLGRVKIYGRNSKGSTQLLFIFRKSSYKIWVSVAYSGYWIMYPPGKDLAFLKHLTSMGLKQDCGGKGWEEDLKRAIEKGRVGILLENL